MKYYRAHKEWEPKVIGVKTGLGQVEIDRSRFTPPELYDDIHNFFSSQQYFARVDHRPRKEHTKLFARVLPKAKLTDFLWFSPYFMAAPFMVSEELKKCLAVFSLPEHYYIPTKIFKNDAFVTSYYLLYCPLLSMQTINYKQSIFHGALFPKKKYLTFESEAEFKSYSGLAFPEKIVLNNLFDRTLDFVNAPGGCFVSDRLNGAIEDHGFTGMIIDDSVPTLELE